MSQIHSRRGAAAAPLHPSGQPAGRRGRSRRACFVFVRGLARAYLWLFGSLLLWGLAPVLIGWNSMSVTSGSMEPSIVAGDVVVVDDSSGRGVDEGDVVAVEVAGAEPLTHRAIELDPGAEGSGTLVTKGDANATKDAPVPVGSLIGTARIVVPLVGLPSLWLDRGEWVVFVGWTGLTAAAIAIASRRDRRDRRRSMGRRGKLVPAGLLALVVAISVPMATSAEFTGASAGSAAWSAASPLHASYQASVAARGAVGHWRLGDVNPPATVLSDDFETFSGWSDIQTGRVEGSTTYAYSGSASLRKTANNDPRGGRKALLAPVGDHWTMSVWVYRPAGYTGGAQDRISVEDASGNGYGVRVIHSGSGRLTIERRNNGSGSQISTTNWNPPEGSWFRLELSRDGGDLVGRAYDLSGTAVATTSASDSTHHSFDHVAVRGGHDYFIDDLEVRDDSVTAAYADAVGTNNATRVGAPVEGMAGLLVGDPDQAILIGGGSGVQVPSSPSIDGPLDGRSVVAWIEPASLTGRQVVWAQGDVDDGLALYLDGDTLRARLWSGAAGWQPGLELDSTVGAGRHQVVLAFDLSAGTASLHVDGVSVDAITFAPRPPLQVSPGNTSIGVQSGALELHDGADGGPNGLAGTIDEVSFHALALDPAQVGTLYGAGS